MKAAPRVDFVRRAPMTWVCGLLIALYVTWQASVLAATPYPAYHEYDEGVYIETAAASAAGSRPYTAVFLSQPPLLIEVLAHVFGALGDTLTAARGTVVAFSALWLAGLAMIASRTGAPTAGMCALAVAASAPAFVFASRIVEMEGPAEALAAMAVAFGLAAVVRPCAGASRAAVGLWVPAGLLAGLAVMTKLSALTCLVPLAVVAGAAAGDTTFGRTGARAAVFTGGALTGAAAAAVWSGGVSMNMWRQIVVFHGAVARMTPVDLGHTASMLWRFAAANWFLTALGAGGVICAFAARRDTRSAAQREPGRIPASVATAAMTAWLLADVAALLLWRPVWPHHLAILITPLAVLGGCAAGTVLSPTREVAATVTARAHGRVSVLAVGALLAAWLVALGTTLMAARPEASDALRTAAAETQLAVPPSAQVIADDPLIAFLAGRAVPPNLCDTSEARMRSGWLSVSDLRAALGDRRVRGVVLWRGTFRRLAPEFVAEAVNQFPHRVNFTATEQLLVR
jgi:hypothetical protein